jgi:hypothetical protein
LTRWRPLPPCAATRAGVEAAISRARPASAMKQGSTFAGHREAGAVLLRDAGSTDEAPTGMAPGLMDDLTGTTPLHMGTDPDDAGRACAESPDAVVVPVPMAAARGMDRTLLLVPSLPHRVADQARTGGKNDVEGLSQASGHCGGRRACGPGVGRRASRCAGGRGPPIHGAVRFQSALGACPQGSAREPSGAGSPFAMRPAAASVPRRVHQERRSAELHG